MTEEEELAFIRHFLMIEFPPSALWTASGKPEQLILRLIKELEDAKENKSGENNTDRSGRS